MAEYHGYQEPPEMLGRNIHVSTRLWVAMQAFFYAAFVFTFFYLQQLNSNHQWRPHGVTPQLDWGSAVLAANLVGAACYWLARAALHRRGEGTWSLAGALALLLSLAAWGLQAAEWRYRTFNPTQGGYASVFYAWTGLYFLNGLFLCYWLWTLVIEPRRARRAFGSSAVLQANAEALGFYWAFFAIAGVVQYVLLYIVA
jgi:heme/copper-type cytochrome/quinol oxidase subunit 3